MGEDAGHRRRRRRGGRWSATRPGRPGGFGAEVAARITEELFDVLEAPVASLGARAAHIPFSPPRERAVVPQHEEIVEATRQVVVRRRQPV
jgi:pyruvate/2-oxoglutarate/acetoin dehydrogenase E1 component